MLLLLLLLFFLLILVFFPQSIRFCSPLTAIDFPMSRLPKTSGSEDPPSPKCIETNILQITHLCNSNARLLWNKLQVLSGSVSAKNIYYWSVCLKNQTNFDEVWSKQNNLCSNILKLSYQTKNSIYILVYNTRPNKTGNNVSIWCINAIVYLCPNCTM